MTSQSLRLMLPLLTGSLIFFAGAGRTQTIKQDVEKTALGREEALRSAGVQISDDDRQAIRYLERFRIEVANTRKTLAEYQKAYNTQGDKTRADEIAASRKRIELLAKQQNIPLDKQVNSESIMQYHTEMRKYRDDSGRKKTREWLDKATKNIPTYEREVGDIVKQQRSGKPLKPTKPVITGGGGGGGGRGDLSQMEIYVGQLSGDVEFYINDQKVERVRQTFPLNGKGTLTLRVVALEPNRKRFRSLSETERMSILIRDDHQVKYEVKSGIFNASTHWNVNQETYSWAVTQQPNINTEFSVGNSGKPGVSQDTVMFTFTGRFSYAATVKGSVDWKGTSTRPGGNREEKASGKAAGSIMISVGGKG